MASYRGCLDLRSCHISDRQACGFPCHRTGTLLDNVRRKPLSAVFATRVTDKLWITGLREYTNAPQARNRLTLTACCFTNKGYHFWAISVASLIGVPAACAVRSRYHRNTRLSVADCWCDLWHGQVNGCQTRSQAMTEGEAFCVYAFTGLPCSWPR